MGNGVSSTLQVSVAICTYRRPDVLPAAIESLLRQTVAHDRYEIIVVDNNSQDDTGVIVQQYVDKYAPRIRYVQEARQGLSYARNKAIEVSHGEVVAFLDDDAEASEEWLSVLLEQFAENPDIWVVGGKVLPNWCGTRPEWLRENLFRSLSLVDWGGEVRALTWPERLIGTNIAFRHSVFQTTGLFAVDLGRRGNSLLGNEDTEIQKRVHDLGKTVMYSPEAIVYHEVSAARMRKWYFYKRAYGTGRTQAILSLRGNVLRRNTARLLASSAVSLSRACTNLVLNFRQEDARFSTIQGVCRYAGVIRQSASMLCKGRRGRQGH